MKLELCKKNLDTYQGGPVVLRSGREAVRIAERLRDAALFGADVLRAKGMPDIAMEIERRISEVI